MEMSMYTAVRMAKMNACRKLTKTSKPVIATSKPNESGAMTTVKLAAHSAAVNTANVVRMRWPASMLAKSRTISENGRMMNVERNSMGASSTYMKILATTGMSPSGGNTEFTK